MSWETINPHAWCYEATHLWRYEPDVVNGGSWLFDKDGNKWAIRTCAICGEQQRREVEAYEDVADLLRPTAEDQAA